MTVRELNNLLDGEFEGDGNVAIERIAKIEDAGQGDITFLANLKYKKYLATTNASAVLVARNTTFEELNRRANPIILIRVADPYAAFLQLIEHFHPAPAPPATGIHPSAVIAPSAILGNDLSIGAHVVIGDRCVIAGGTAVYHNSVLHDGVRVGKGTIIYANVTIREECTIGDRAIIHSGTVIGSDGFGFAPLPDGTYKKIPQRGIVAIEDDVEIGANCAIDRATIGETRIRRGAKLDNLIQIAHNVVIGEDTVIAAQSGISGSTRIGNRCMLGGQVGVAGHLEIADRITLGAQSGVSKSLTQSDKIYFGYPVKELQQALRIEAALRQLPELISEVRRLEQRCSELEKSLHDHEKTSQLH